MVDKHVLRLRFVELVPMAVITDFGLFLLVDVEDWVVIDESTWLRARDQRPPRHLQGQSGLWLYRWDDLLQRLHIAEHDGRVGGTAFLDIVLINSLIFVLGGVACVI